MSLFDSKEQVLDIIQRMLRILKVPKESQQDVMSKYRARLHFGFWAGHCSKCTRIISIAFNADQTFGHSEGYCEDCKDMVDVEPWTWESWKEQPHVS